MKHVTDGHELNRMYTRVWFGLSGSASMRDYIRYHVEIHVDYHVENRVGHHVENRVQHHVVDRVLNRVEGRVRDRVRGTRVEPRE